jgi:hypothetical protein
LTASTMCRWRSCLTASPVVRCASSPRPGAIAYAYCSGGETTGHWCVWLGGLADARPDHEGRVPLDEWVTNWRDLLAESEGGAR